MQGWRNLVAEVTLTYSTADAPVFVASTSDDLTGLISPGMRLRLSQSTGGTKYFIVVTIDSSTVTLYGGTDYTLNNEAISSPVFSSEKAPFGFPLNPDKWTVIVSDSSRQDQSSPTTGTWYNLGSITISVPIGIWNVEYEAAIQVDKSSAVSMAVYSTLSTSNNSETDAALTAVGHAASVNGIIHTVYRRKILAVTSKTSYYLDVKNTETSANTISLRGEISPTIIRAICAYL